MKKLLTMILTSCLLWAAAQEPAGRSISEKGVSADKPKKNETQNLTTGSPIGGIVVKGGKNQGGNLLISLDGGVLLPGAATKNGANPGNLSNFNINAYLPLIGFGGTGEGIISKTFGVNIGGGYFSGSPDYTTGNYTPYNISGQSSSPILTVIDAGNPKLQGLTAEAGLQANFSFGKMTVSPIVNAAYFSLKQQAFSIVQNSTVNGQNLDYTIYAQPETKSDGFALIPKLRLSYFPGRVGFFIEGNYTAGPAIKNEAAVFKPQGKANAEGFYSIDQMMTGNSRSISKDTRYNAFGVMAGVTIALGKVLPDSIERRTKKQKKGDRNFGEKVPAGIQSANAMAVRSNSTGNLNYNEDYSLSDPEILAFLNTDRLIIKKGTYPADYTQNPFGTLTLELQKPIDAKSINEKGIKRLSSGGFRCDKDCKEEKDICFTCKTGSSKALYYYFDLEPVIENGAITQIQIKNKKNNA